MTTDRLTAAILATFAAVSGIPLAVAQLDFAGVVNIFRIDHGDVPHALLVLAGIGGALTCCVIAAAIIGAGLCLTRPDAARPVLLAAALAGLFTALPLWLPNALAMAAAVHLLDPARTRGKAARAAA